MFDQFLPEECKIIRKKSDFSGGLAVEIEEIIATEKCRKTSPNQRDFQLIQHMEINKQVWKLYLSKTSSIHDYDVVEIEGVRYTPIYIYPVRGRKEVHHFKLLVIAIK